MGGHGDPEDWYDNQPDEDFDLDDFGDDFLSWDEAREKVRWRENKKGCPPEWITTLKKNNANWHRKKPSGARADSDPTDAAV